MEASFWHQKWERNEIGFHQSEPNPFLVEHINTLEIPRGSRFFLPLCGKTLDLVWLLSQGFRVCGAELNQKAVDGLFAGMEIEPAIREVEEIDSLLHYSADNIDVFLGDVFDVTGELLGPVDAIYDRAALVALPGDTRPAYTNHLQKITGRAPQMLITFEYDQAEMSGPPFSISQDEVFTHYQDAYQIESVKRQVMPGGFKGKIEATEVVWLLRALQEQP